MNNMYEKFDMKSYEKKNEDNRKIIYFNSIGTKSDEILNEIFKLGCLYGPRIKKSKFGTLNATKYSFVFYDEETINKIINLMRDIINEEYRNEVVLLKQNERNWFICNQIKYF